MYLTKDTPMFQKYFDDFFFQILWNIIMVFTTTIFNSKSFKVVHFFSLLKKHHRQINFSRQIFIVERNLHFYLIEI